jgi:hypothetical protein
MFCFGAKRQRSTQQYPEINMDSTDSKRPGGLDGKAVAEHFDPTVEEQYWRGANSSESYYKREFGFEDYAPAYRVGGEALGRYRDAAFEDVESDLEDDYRRGRGTSRLEWDDARDATRAAWTRVRGTSYGRATAFRSGCIEDKLPGAMTDGTVGAPAVQRGNRSLQVHVSVWTSCALLHEFTP